MGDNWDWNQLTDDERDQWIQQAAQLLRQGRNLPAALEQFRAEAEALNRTRNKPTNHGRKQSIRNWLSRYKKGK